MLQTGCCRDTGCQQQCLREWQAAGGQFEPESQSEPVEELSLQQHQPRIQMRNGSFWFHSRGRMMRLAPDKGQEQGAKYGLCAQQGCEVESRNILLQINNLFIFILQVALR